MSEPLSIDQIIERILELCSSADKIVPVATIKTALTRLHSRLSGGELHIAIIGQFNRGKSTFINRLLNIDHLPVSVLPLTAIPTEIRYGEKSELEITFPDNTMRFSEHDAIHKALEEYVTEGGNPENRKSVESVTLSAPSTILSHGTIIIDTPGFGSTHIHNTKATLDRLKECDAALFMLSADLPITQMELNFIKQIAPQVTRLFFVYNKTDLLNSEELDKTISFIRKTIETQLHISTNERFFPVSARIAESDRDKSGISLIETEVLDFLLREKYFSLAEAIRSKLQDEINALEELLLLKKSELTEEINELIDNRKQLESDEAVLAESLAELEILREAERKEWVFPETVMETVTSEISNLIARYDREGIPPLKEIEISIGDIVVMTLNDWFPDFIYEFTEGLPGKDVRISFPLKECRALFPRIAPYPLNVRLGSKEKKLTHLRSTFDVLVPHYIELLKGILNTTAQDLASRRIVTAIEEVTNEITSLQNSRKELDDRIEKLQGATKSESSNIDSIIEELHSFSL